MIGLGFSSVLFFGLAPRILKMFRVAAVLPSGFHSLNTHPCYLSLTVRNMPLAIPPELKKIVPYVRRAEELDKDQSAPESRLVAYYCRQYAVVTGIPLAGSSAAAKTCLGHLLENLEAEKPAMDNFTREEAAFLSRKFAKRVFDKADGEDRMGMANKNTAKTFYAAANFLQILEQFYDDGDESEERADDRKRIIYAKWKATEILKAIKEGREPTPGGYGEQEPLEEEGADEQESEPVKKQDAPVVETIEEEDSEEMEKEEDVYVPPPPVPPPAPEEESEEDIEDEGTEVQLGPPPAYPGGDSDKDNSKPTTDRPPVTFSLPAPAAERPVPPPQAKKKSGGGMFGLMKNKKGSKVSKSQLADAAELTRFALSAIEDKDADLAAKRLQQAIEALGR